MLINSQEREGEGSSERDESEVSAEHSSKVSLFTFMDKKLEVKGRTMKTNVIINKRQYLERQNV